MKVIYHFVQFEPTLYCSQQIITPEEVKAHQRTLVCLAWSAFGSG